MMRRPTPPRIIVAPSDQLEFLRSTTLFAGVPRASLERVAEIAKEKRHDAGKVIVRQDGQAHAFHLIVEGQVDVAADGVHIATLGPGEYFGEIAVAQGVRRTATVSAHTPVRVLAIDTVSFRRLAASDHALAENLPVSIEERLLDRHDKLIGE